MLKETTKEKFTLEFIEERIENIPALPYVVCELIQISQDAHDFFEKVEDLAAKSPILATKILSFANSVASASCNQITNLQNALIRLGVFKTLSLITVVTFTHNLPHSKSHHKAIWRHSLETAFLSKYLAESLSDLRIDKDLTYLCGLLHDLGRFVFLHISPKIVDVTDSKCWSHSCSLSQVEYELFGFTHADTGYLAARKWQLPGAITDVIQHHHRNDIWQKEEGTIEFRQRLTIVQFADAICTLIQHNPEWRSWPDDVLRERLISDCIQKCWPTIDFKIDELIASLPDLIAECDQISKELGVNQSEDTDQ